MAVVETRSFRWLTAGTLLTTGGGAPGATFTLRGQRRRCESGRGRRAAGRAGLASVDYVLVLGVMLPMIALILWVAPQMMNLAYEMICVLVSWPFQ